MTKYNGSLFSFRPQPRIVVVLAGFIAFFILLAVRLADTQLLNGAEFRVRADDNRTFSLAVTADRGIILDRYGEPLVLNTKKYFEVSDPKALYHEKIPISREKGLALLATDSSKVVTQHERFYPFPAVSAMVGYVGGVTAEDLSSGRATASQQRIGKFALEAAAERSLRGADGKEIFEVNALGQRQKKIQEVPAVSGQQLQTTFDPYLSTVAMSALQGQKGAVIIADAKTGEVLSMVSSPSFDSNLLSQTTATKETEQERQRQISSLFTDERQLFFNRAVNGSYPLGSIFKLVTAMAGLESNKLDSSTQVLDEGSIKIGEYEYKNWFYTQYGRTDGSIGLVRALARSNDIYFYKAAEWIGPTQLAETARLFGFGEPTGVEIKPEARGLVPDPTWKETVLSEPWYLGNTYHFGIGQGDLSVTPIQVTQLLQALGNQGSICKPTVLQSTQRECRELSLQSENIELVLLGMLDACSAGGTAYPFFTYNSTRRVADASVQDDLDRGAIACKTGTAEFGGTDERGYRKTHGWFTAIFHLPTEQLTTSNEGLGQSLVASESAATTTMSGELAKVDRLVWQNLVKKHGFPDKLVMIAVVESDEDKPFKEGSADAGPVIKTILDWMVGQ
ncbi:MAG: penicillin-binding transpeptidase domain-containing protein [bacterium]|nr:penicillin-binding transpeptidase domain-containing protein [bacterium]